MNPLGRRLLAPDECRALLTADLECWSLEGEGKELFIQRVFATPTWGMTVHAANAVALLAELGWHHPVLVLDYKSLTVKLRSNDVEGITMRDIELAHHVEATLTWLPQGDDALTGHKRRYVR